MQRRPHFDMLMQKGDEALKQKLMEEEAAAEAEAAARKAKVWQQLRPG